MPGTVPAAIILNDSTVPSRKYRHEKRSVPGAMIVSACGRDAGMSQISTGYNLGQPADARGARTLWTSGAENSPSMLTYALKCGLNWRREALSWNVYNNDKSSRRRFHRLIFPEFGALLPRDGLLFCACRVPCVVSEVSATFDYAWAPETCSERMRMLIADGKQRSLVKD